MNGSPENPTRTSPPENANQSTAWRTLGRVVGLEKIGLLLVLTASFVLFAPTLSYQFVYDDIYQIAQNEHVHSWRFLPVYFTQGIWSQVANSDSNLYRPLFLVWLRLNMVVFGDQPSGWHLTTVLMHVLVVALAYLLARFVLKNSVAALVAAAVFAVHPIHTEAVAWVSGVAEPLFGALFLGSLLCYLKQRAEAKGKLVWQILSVGLFSAAVLAKETAVVLPLVIAAYEFTLSAQDGRLRTSSQRSFFRQVCAAVAPYLGVLSVYFAARAFAMGALHPGTVPLRTSLLSWPWLLWTYVRLSVWPTNLSPSYDFPYVGGLSQLRFVLPVAGSLGAGLVLWLWSRWQESRLGAFLAAWFVITLAPAMAASCLAYSDESLHDRYLYLPSLGFALLVGAAFGKLRSHSKFVPKSLAWGLAGTILVGLTLCTHRQLRYWESNYALFQRATEIAPHNERAAMNFAAELMKRREYHRVLKICQAMIKLNPESERPVGSAALASFLLQDYPAAESYYVRADQLEPSQGNLFYFLGLTRMRQGNYGGAANALETAVSLSPRAVFFHYTLGVALAHMQEWPQAREQFSAELQIQASASHRFAQQALWDADVHLLEKRGILKRSGGVSREPAVLPD